MRPFQSVDKATGKLRYGGQWLIKFRAPDGTWRRQVGGGTLKEAEQALADIEYRIRHGQWVDPRLAKKEAVSRAGDCRTFKDIVDKYRIFYSDRAEGSQANLERAVVHLFKGPIPGDTPLSALSKASVQAARESIQAAPLAVPTKNLLLTYVKMVFRWAAKNPIIPIDTDLSEGLEAFRVPGTRGGTGMIKPVGRDEVLSQSDVERMIDVAFSLNSEVNAYMFTTAVSTGMRKGELCGLLWCDVDLGRRILLVCRNYDRRGTKSGEDRTVPVSTELLSSLREWKARTPYSRDTDPVFPGCNGHVRTHGGFHWNRVVRDFAQRAGVDRPALRRYGHQTRHYFATQWLLSGGSDTILAKILGHRDTSLIHSTYSHFCDDDLTRAMDRIGFSVTKPVTKQPSSEVITFPISEGK
jgi:integrase